MSDEPNEADIEKMAWDLETKMQEIRKDPRAALTAELAKIRETMLAEYKAYHARKLAEYKADLARSKADLAQHNAEMKAEIEALWASKKQALQARFDATVADLTPELRACLVDGIRLRQAVRDSLRDEKATT